jgi:hypothetical protein
VTSPAPLTEAEQCAAESLFRLSETGGGYHAAHWTIEDFAVEARAVVAAVRGPLFKGVADRMLQHATDAENNDATEDAVYVFAVAANQIREWAALSLPASKEH